MKLMYFEPLPKHRMQTSKLASHHLPAQRFGVSVNGNPGLFERILNIIGPNGDKR